MINRQTRKYSYSVLGDTDSYGQETVTETGTIDIAIAYQTFNVDGNLRYTTDKFVGVTNDNITDKYIIQYGDKKLKVTYTFPSNGRNYVYLEGIA